MRLLRINNLKKIGQFFHKHKKSQKKKIRRDFIPGEKNSTNLIFLPLLFLPLSLSRAGLKVRPGDTLENENKKKKNTRKRVFR